MRRNPYLNRSMIRSVDGFYGRRREVERIMARIGADPPQSVSVVGERRAGKSSLLWHVSQPQVYGQYLDRPDGFVFVYLDLQGQQHLDLEGFCRAFGAALAQATEGAVPHPAHPGGAGRPGLEGLLQAVMAVESRGQRLVCLWDEFESVTTNEAFDRAFFGFLRSLANAHPVAYVTATRRDLGALCRTHEIAESPFFNIFARLHLGPFSPQEARRLVVEPSAAAGMPLEPHLDTILDLGGRLPFFLQMACSAGFECGVEGGVNGLDGGQLLTRFLEEASPHFNYLWERLSPEARGALTALIRGRPCTDGEAQELPQLEQWGYVEHSTQGWKVFSAGLPAFLERTGQLHAEVDSPAAGQPSPGVSSPSGSMAGSSAAVPAGSNPYPAIVGQSLGMRRVFYLMEKAAAADATVLITGETGTGKEMVARGIHAHSRRAEGPLVIVNCGAIAESLQEAELFGHVKGSFTGATQDRAGLVEAADGGTLFLDEISETTAALQVKLLRVLQNGEVRPVGSTETRRVDVRLICATHRDLAVEVAAGTFRADLYYRLYALTVSVPPLRERGEDIDLLVRHFLESYSAGISAAAMALLRSYSWPGNVRELENQLAAARALAGGAVIAPEHLWDHVRGAATAETRVTRAQSRVGGAEQKGACVPPVTPGSEGASTEWSSGVTVKGMTLKEARSELERRMITERLKQHDGNYQAAAHSLGLSRSRLYELVRKYGISPE